MPPAAPLKVEIDGHPHERWRCIGVDAVEIDLPIDDQQIRLSYR